MIVKSFLFPLSIPESRGGTGQFEGDKEANQWKMYFSWAFGTEKTAYGINR